MQLAKEDIFKEAASKIKDKRTVIICDRGVLDSKAYMQKSTFYDLLKKLKTTEIELRDRYDAVIHLKTAADGAEEFYTLENNAARMETAEEAKIADKKVLNAWTGHSHLRVIDNSTNFEMKINRVLQEFYLLLGVPVPLEIERKFLINLPNIDVLNKRFNVTTINIIQTYLHSEDPLIERRIRQKRLGDGFSYYYTEKKTLDDLSRIEIEHRITEADYIHLMMEADTSLNQIRKDRHCFIYENNYFELDIYPFWKNQAIVEVELTNKDQTVIWPEELELIREVTNEKCFKNKSLAYNHDVC